MASTVVNGPLESNHLREDGTPWPFALAKGERSVFADNAGEIIAHIIPGYDDLPAGPEGDDQALILRWETAATTATDIQALICADRGQEGLFDPANESEDTLTALFQDKMIAVEDVEAWDHEQVPLVLVATDYDPFTDRVPPTGNILWIDPSDEVTFLDSLSNLGVIEFYVHGEE